MAAMKRKAVAIGAVAGALVLVLIIVYFAWLRSASEEVILTAGIVEAREVNLAPKVAGRIEEICCSEGASIEAGQIAIRLLARDLEAALAEAEAGVTAAHAGVRVAQSAIEAADAAVASAQARVGAAQAEVARNQSQLAESDRQLKRARSLVEQHFGSQETVDAAATAYDSTRADLAAARSRLEAAKAQERATMAELDSARTRLDSAQALLAQAQATVRYSQAKLADTEISSPIDGVVVFEALRPGEYVAAGQTVLTIDDMKDRYVRVDIDETRVASLALGDVADLVPVGHAGGHFAGRISEIGRYAEFATQTDVRGGRQDIKTFRVKIAVEDPEVLLKPGMTVEVNIPRRVSP